MFKSLQLWYVFYGNRISCKILNQYLLQNPQMNFKKYRKIIVKIMYDHFILFEIILEIYFLRKHHMLKVYH